MPIRPVDLLSMLPRSAESSRVQQAQEQAPFAFQHALAMEGKAKLEQKANQVPGAPEGEAARLRAHGDGKHKEKREEKRDRKQRSEAGTGAAKRTENEPGQPGVGTRLDVKL
jgi:hypothetical protein